VALHYTTLHGLLLCLLSDFARVISARQVLCTCSSLDRQTCTVPPNLDALLLNDDASTAIH
jgi:hypothetical protein